MTSIAANSDKQKPGCKRMSVRVGLSTGQFVNPGMREKARERARAEGQRIAELYRNNEQAVQWYMALCSVYGPLRATAWIEEYFGKVEA